MIKQLGSKLNNSYQINKTLVMNKQYTHLSYYAEPKQFDCQIIGQRSKNQNSDKYQSSQKQHNQGKFNKVYKNIEGNGSLQNIKKSRTKCNKIGKDVHTALMNKTLKLNSLYNKIHNFLICIDELKWLLHEGDQLLRSHLVQVNLISPTSSHTINISNISQEFRSLVLRFERIEKDRNSLVNDYQYLSKQQELHEQDKINQSGISGISCRKFYAQIPIFKQMPSCIIKNATKINQSSIDANISTYSPFQYNMNRPTLKENINSENAINHFQKIDILKPTSKNNITQRKIKIPPFLQTKQGHSQQSQNQHQQNRDLPAKLQTESHIIESLSAKIQLLMGQISNLQARNIKNKTVYYKSIEKLSQLVKTMKQNTNYHERELQLQKMAQCIHIWQKMKQEELDQQHYNHLFTNVDSMATERATKLEEIIALQYDINHLLAQKGQLEQKVKEKQQSHEDYYRILVLQACTLQQIGSL